MGGRKCGWGLLAAWLLSAPPLMGQRLAPPATGVSPVRVTVGASVQGIDAEALAQTVERLLGAHLLGSSHLELALTRTPTTGWIRMISSAAPLNERARVRSRTSHLPPGSWNALAPTAAGDLGAVLGELAVGSVVADEKRDPPPLAASLSNADVDAFSPAPGGVALVVAGVLERRGPAFETVPSTALALARRIQVPDGMHVGQIRVLVDGRIALGDADGGVWIADHQVDDPVARVRRLAAAPKPVGPSGRTLIGGDGSTTTVTAAGVDFLQPRPGRLRLPVPALRPGAAELDNRGNLWVLDTAERRVRVFATSARGVRQIYSVTPRIPVRDLAEVQTLALAADGGLLLGSRDLVTRLGSDGEPLWHMVTLPTVPPRRLPAAYVLHASAGDARAFYLHDLTTGDVHLFSRAPPAPPDSGRHVLVQAAMKAARRYDEMLLPEMALELYALARRQVETARAADPLDTEAAELFSDVDVAQSALRAQLGGDIGERLEVGTVRYYPALELWYQEEPHRWPVTVLGSGRATDTASVERRLSVGFGGAGSARLLAEGTLRSDVPLAATPIPPRRAATTTIVRAGQLTIIMESAESAGAEPTRQLARVEVFFRPWFEMPESAASAANSLAAALRWLVRPGATFGPTIPAAADPLALLEALTVGATVVPIDGSQPLQSVDQTLATRVGTNVDWVAALAAVAIRLGVQARLWWDGAPMLVLFGEPGWLGDNRLPGVLPARGRQALTLTQGMSPAAAMAILPLAPDEAGEARTLDAWMQDGAARVGAALRRGDGQWQLLPLEAASRAGATLAQPRPLVPLHPLLRVAPH